jgi:competence protein ComEC
MLHRPLIPALFLFIGGIFSGHAFMPRGHYTLLCLFSVSVCLLVILLLVSSPGRLYLCFFLFFLLGAQTDLIRHHRSTLSELAEARPQVLIDGTILEPAIHSGDLARLILRVDTLTREGKQIRSGEKVRLTVFGQSREFSPGERIRCRARLGPFRNFNNPGRYNYELAMDAAGLVCVASVSDGRRIVSMGKGDFGFPWKTLESIRKPVRDFFEANLSVQNQAILKALILGERQSITREIRDAFNGSGLSHVLAVSGLHIAVVAWLCYTFLKKLLSLSSRLILRTDIRKLSALMTCLPVIGYTGLTGFQISAVRAMIMGLAYLLSLVLSREKDVWSTLAVTALIVLGLDPHALFSISAQLSFLAVVGILWLSPIISRWLYVAVDEQAIKSRALNFFYSYVVGLIAVTLSATIFLLPITTYYFHQVPLMTFPLNLTLVPVLGVFTLCFGILASLLLPASIAAARCILDGLAWVLDRVMEILHFWTRFDWATLWGITPSWFEISLFYGLLLSLFLMKRWRWAKLGLAGLLCLAGMDVAYWFQRTHHNPHLRVTYLDVGQGSAALVELPGRERMLIDGGGSPGDDFDVGEMVVARFLAHSKIRRIDYLVLTHPETDHMEGLRFIASHFGSKEFWYTGDQAETSSFRDLMGVIESKGIQKFTPQDLRDGREIAGVKISVLHPLSVDRSRSMSKLKINDRSLVLKISSGERSFLFPGDLESLGEEILVHHAGERLKSDVLLTPHHGSKSSSTLPFLQMVAPSVCIISSRESSRSGLPHIDTLMRLQEIGCRVLRIDEVGAVQITVGSEGLQVKSFLE